MRALRYRREIEAQQPTPDAAAPGRADEEVLARPVA